MAILSVLPQAASSLSDAYGQHNIATSGFPASCCEGHTADRVSVLFYFVSMRERK